VTISCGIACDSSGFDVVFAKADTALYQAKNGGRNQVVIYSAADADNSEKISS